MIIYDFYRVDVHTFSDAFGVRAKIEEVRFMTNNANEGIFDEWGGQKTGTCQFRGKEKEIIKWLNHDENYLQEYEHIRYFLTNIGAKRYKNKIEKLYPIKKGKIPTNYEYEGN